MANFTADDVITINPSDDEVENTEELLELSLEE